MNQDCKSLRITNREFAATDHIFRNACQAVGEEGILPTKRQASKWRMKRGIAYKDHFASRVAAGFAAAGVELTRLT